MLHYLSMCVNKMIFMLLLWLHIAASTIYLKIRSKFFSRVSEILYIAISPTLMPFGIVMHLEACFNLRQKVGRHDWHFILITDFIYIRFFPSYYIIPYPWMSLGTAMHPTEQVCVSLGQKVGLQDQYFMLHWFSSKFRSELFCRYCMPYSDVTWYCDVRK